MKIQTLKIDGYKNLKNFEMNFEENSSINALIGVNGSGKSNVLEAIAETFLIIKDKEPPYFNFEMKYEFDGSEVNITSEPHGFKCGKPAPVPVCQSFAFDSSHMELSQFKQFHPKIPESIFLYYAGETKRFKDRTQLLKDNAFQANLEQGERIEIKYVSYISLDDFPILLLAVFLYELEMPQTISNLTQITDCKPPLQFHIKRPEWCNQELLMEDSFWGLHGVFSETLQKLKDIGNMRIKSTDTGIITIDDLSKFKPLFSSSYDMFVTLKMLMQADILDYVSYSVVKNEELEKAFPVDHLSEGEKQLSLLLCLLTVTKDRNSLFLLDEMDTYLHPMWQRELTSLVSDIDIRGQVLMTTHSPLTLGKMNKENIRILKNGEVFEPSVDTMNRDIVEVLEEIMDVGARPTEVEECITGFKSAVAFKNKDLAVEYQEKLKKYLGKTDPFWNTVDVLMRRLNR